MTKQGAKVVAQARRASLRAERRITAARRSGNELELQAARAHWDHTLRDLHRVLVAVGQ